MLAIITALFNPAGFATTGIKYREFRSSLRADSLLTVELSWNGQYESPDGIHLTGGPQHILWQKERLLNIAINSLPPEVTKVAWLDADIFFLSPRWVYDARRRLDQFPVIQLFDTSIDLDAYGIGRGRVPSWGSVAGHQRPQIGPNQVGHGWAARREIIADGLFDRMIVGGADWLMASAWLGMHRTPQMLQLLPEGLQREYLSWADRQYQRVNGQVSFVPGKILHKFHGRKKNRKYFDRYEPLRRFRFDPSTDLSIDENGLWRWNSEKHELHKAVRDYFAGRDEDATTDEAKLRGETSVDDTKGQTMSPDEIDFLKRHLNKSQHYLEFGLGASTVMATESLSITKIDTVESSPQFAADFLCRTPALNAHIESRRVCIHKVDIGPTVAWGFPKDKSQREKWDDYPSVVRRLDRSVDTVLIDGRFRMACLAEILMHLPSTTTILIHDFRDRPVYQEALKVTELIESVDTMALLKRRDNLTDAEIHHFRTKFSNDPR